MRRAIILTALIAVWLAHAVSAQNGPGSSSALGTTAKPNSIVPRSVPAYAPTQPWKGKFLPDGQPELPPGIWKAVEPQTRYIDRPPPGAIMASRVVDPPDGLIPYQPWAREIKKTQNDDLEHPTKPWHIDTQGRCLNTVPRLMHYLTPYAVHQGPGLIVFQYELEHLTRVIPLDGSKHIGSAIKLWMGDARGHWEGNTLVVDTTNLNGIARLSSSGDFYSANAHLKERMTYVDATTMTYEATIDDPTVFTRPWTIRVAHKLDPAPLTVKPGQDLDDEIVEYMCYEGEAEGVRRESLGQSHSAGRVSYMKAIVVLTLLLAASAPVLAHHQFSSEFDANKKVTLTGKVTKMAWVNPHAWLYIDVTQPDGKVVNWALEFGIPRTLIRQGWRKEDLPAGATVVVEAFLAKNGSNSANANTVTLADGRRLFAGSSYGGDGGK